MIIPLFGSCSEITKIDLRSITTLGVQGPAFQTPRLKYYKVEPPRHDDRLPWRAQSEDQKMHSLYIKIGFERQRWKCRPPSEYVPRYGCCVPLLHCLGYLVRRCGAKHSAEQLDA